MLDEGEQHGVKGIGAHMGGEPIQRGGHDLRIELLAVLGNEDMAGLVNEAHGVKLPGMDCAVGMMFDVADLIHAVRELAARSHIGKYHVARIGEERLSELIALARIPRNVEFHHWKTCSL